MTLTNDQINAIFEFGGSLLILNNCRILMRDKIVRGVSTLATAYFMLWGAWTLFFYPSLHQMWSFAAQSCICTANILWIALMLYYKHQEKKLKTDVKFASTTEGAVNS